MKISVRVSLVAGFCAMLLGGCVSTHPLHSSQSVRVTSTPEGATVTTPQGESCVTPCKLRMLTDRGGTIHFEKEGYHPEDMLVSSYISDERVAWRATSYAIEATDPDPVSIALSMVGNLIDAKGPISDLDAGEVSVILAPIGADEIARLQHTADNIPPASPERVAIDFNAPAPQGRIVTIKDQPRSED